MGKQRSNVLLVTAALIWGCAFVAQSIGMDYVGPWTFNCIRNLIGGISLLAVMPFLKKCGFVKENPKHEKAALWKGGIACGIVLTAASIFQQTGIAYTTVGKAGFITALYVVIVPLLAIFLGKKTTLKVWMAVLIALIGFYFLSLMDGFALSKGDALILVCAFLFAIHILVIDHFSPLVNGVKLSCMQFFVAGAISFLPMIRFEQPQISDLLRAAGPLLYAGVLSSGAGYTLQIIGQKDAEPTVATLLLSLESVFSLLAGFVILHQALSVRELVGCALVFAGIILAQLPDKYRKESRS